MKALSFILLLVATALLSVSAITPDSSPPSDSNDATPPLPNDRMKILVDQEIVPHILRNAPSTMTKLSWGALRLHEFNLTVLPSQVSERPLINYNVHANRLYTVALFDPDAPSRDQPFLAPWIHWLVVNVPGRDIARGDTIVEYAGPSPPPDTGLHRYIIVVHEQSRKIPLDRILAVTPVIPRQSNAGRHKFMIDRFLAHHDAGAKLISTNFFQAEFEKPSATIADLDKTKSN